MGQVRKIGDEYYIEFYARGLLYQQKAGTEHSAAVRMLEEVEGKIAHGEMGTIVRDADIDVFFKTFLEDINHEHSAIVHGRFQKTIQHFERFLKDKYPQMTKLSGVTPAVMEKYRVFLMHTAKERTPPVKAHILNLTLVLLEAVLDHALKLGYLNDHPMLHLAWVPKRSKGIEHIKEDRLRALLKDISDKEATVLQLMLLTGLSLDELKTISFADIDFENNQIKIVRGPTRNRTVPMHTVVREILSVAKGEEWDLIAMGEKYKKLDKEFPKALVRNTFAYFALKRGLRLTDLYSVMGYDDVLNVMRYAELLPAKVII